METIAKEKSQQHEVDAQKREFIKKFGKYAATAPLGMYLLMGPGASKAQASGSSCHTTGHICGCVYIRHKDKWVSKRIDFDATKYGDKVVVHANKAFQYNKGKVWKIVATDAQSGHEVLHIENPKHKARKYDNLADWKQDIIDQILDALGC